MTKQDTRILFSGIIFASMSLQTLCGTCSEMVVRGQGYAVCVPTTWYRHQINGAIFMCSEPKGHCTSSGGGLPLKGQATLAVMPIDPSEMSNPEISLSGIARSFVREPAARISAPVHVTGAGRNLEYVCAWEPFDLGGLNGKPLDQYSYFIRIGKALFRATLSLHADDARSSDYLMISREVVTSVRLVPLDRR